MITIKLQKGGCINRFNKMSAIILDIRFSQFTLALIKSIMMLAARLNGDHV